MPESVATITKDLLNFYGEGNAYIFDSCFRRALEYLGVRINDRATFEKEKRVVFHHLNTVGYLEHDKKAGTWVVAPPALVELDRNNYAFIGSSFDAQKIKKELASNFTPIIKTCSRESGSQNKPLLNRPIYFSITEEQARMATSETAISLQLNYQNEIFKLFPSLESISSQQLKPVLRNGVFEPNSSTYFNEQTHSWIPYAEMNPTKVGVYKREYRFCPPSFFITQSDSKGTLKTFEVEREWVVLCYLALTKRKIRLKFDTLQRTLSLERDWPTGLGLPTILERCLKSGNLSAPKWDRNLVTYSGLNKTNIWLLTSKIPIFSVEIQ